MNTRTLCTAMFVLALTACGRSDEGGSGGGGGKTVQNKGSDTMVNLAQAWAEEYRKVKPLVCNLDHIVQD